MRKIFITTLFAALSMSAIADETFSYMPHFSGGVRGRFEYAPQIDKGRFAVRNARLVAQGNVVPIVSYTLDVDLCNEGSIQMLDAFVAIKPLKPLTITVGQFRPGFTIAAHRSPFAQYFTDRSYIARQSSRDVGLMAGWKFNSNIPVSLQGSVFNGIGSGNHKDKWTSQFGFAFKGVADLTENIGIEASCERKLTGAVNVYMYDAGAFYHDNRWRIEAEYLRKNYAHKAFDATDMVDFFGSYRLPLRKRDTSVSFGARYEYMSDNSNGTPDDNGYLFANQVERHRATLGVTYRMKCGPIYCDLRLDYEQYFYGSNAHPADSERNKLVAEVVCKF